VTSIHEVSKYVKHPYLIVPSLKLHLKSLAFPWLAKLWVKMKGREALRRGHLIFLFGHSGGRSYGDNSAVLFEHMITTHPKIDCYWVMREDAFKEHKKNGGRRIPGKVLFMGSFRANVMALLAHAYIYTHGRYDVTDYSKKDTPDVIDVLQGHGICAMKRKISKKRIGESHAIVGCAKDADLIAASSQTEGDIKCKQWGIPRDKIVVTGLPRYDRLSRLKNEIKERKSILYMPTWRDWEAKAVSLHSTSYFKNVKAFIIDSGLNEYLKEKGYSLLVYVHIRMRDFFDSLKQLLSNVQVLSPNVDLQDVILSSSMLVTDYSSICWDFLYLDKPVIFFQFDLEKYIEHRGAYLDLKKDLFGPVAYTPEKATLLVKYIVDSGFSTEKWNKKREEMKRFAFDYQDGRNCERLAQKIFERLKTANKGAVTCAGSLVNSPRPTKILDKGGQK